MRRLEAGETGRVSVRRLATGKFEARARVRRFDGFKVEVRTQAPSAEAALAATEKKIAALLRPTTGSSVHEDDTVAQAVESWLESRTVTQAIEASTIDTYRAYARHDVLPYAGKIRLSEITAPLLNRIYEWIITERGHGAARRAHKIMSIVMEYAVSEGAIPTASPVRDARGIPNPRKKKPGQRSLSARDLGAIFEALDDSGAWDADCHMANTSRDLRDVIAIVASTSARIGEVLALRPCDITVDEPGRMRISINGTIKRDSAKGLHRKSSPKHASQVRVVPVAAAGRHAIRQRMVDAGVVERSSQELLFRTRNGRAVDPRHFQKSLRRFRLWAKGNLELSFDAEALEFRSLRRTVATLLADGADPRLAQKMLGHRRFVTTELYLDAINEVPEHAAKTLDSIMIPLLDLPADV